MRVNERTISWTKCKLWSWSYKLSFLCTYWPAKAKLMPSFICSSSTTWLTLSVRERTRLGRRFNSVKKKTVYWMRWVRHMTMSFSDIYYRCPHCAFKCVWMTIINGSLIFFPSVWRDDFPKLTIKDMYKYLLKRVLLRIDFWTPSLPKSLHLRPGEA